MLEMVDTIGEVGWGDMIATGSAFLLEIYRRRAERSPQREERYRDVSEKPVVAFVDEMLGLVSKDLLGQGGREGVRARAFAGIVPRKGGLDRGASGGQ